MSLRCQGRRASPGGSPAALETNVYTGDGLLAASTDASGVTTFLYDPQNSNQLVEAGGTYYIYGPQRTPIEQISASATDYLVPDAIGSTRALVSAAGTVDATTSYSPYGQVTATTGTPSAIGFAGTYTDSTTNMDYMVNRWYDPEVGEFVSVDPLVGFTNQAYEYGGDAPVNNIDPYGLFCIFGHVDSTKNSPCRGSSEVNNALAPIFTGMSTLLPGFQGGQLLQACVDAFIIEGCVGHDNEGNNYFSYGFGIGTGGFSVTDTGTGSTPVCEVAQGASATIAGGDYIYGGVDLTSEAPRPVVGAGSGASFFVTWGRKI